MIARLLITILIAIQTFYSIGQSGNESLNKMIEKNNARQLDSVYSKINVFKDQFYRIDSSRWFYIYTDTLTDSLGNYSIGNFILEPFGDFDGRQIGYWTQYYSNDSIMSVGNYGIGAITWCQSVGPTISGYSFKIGEWQYYYLNGKLKAKGVYDIVTKEFRNNCGGDASFVSKTNEKWLMFDESGGRLVDREKLITEIEGM